MGLLDYYRQFEDVDQEEINRKLRERRARERELALQTVAVLDLSSTEWPDFPNSEIVNASIAAARGRVNGYPDRHAVRIRRSLAERHGVTPEQIAVGNGAGELMQAAALALLGTGDELVTSWPSYALYPLMASRAGARPVPVPTAAGHADLDALHDAVNERTRVLVVCNPNDPTGTYITSERLAQLMFALPEEVHVFLDEALIHFQDAEAVDAGIGLLEAFPRLLVFRSFSKIYGLSGLRAGYVVGSGANPGLLDRIAPVLGVNVLTQAGVFQALHIGDREIERRRTLVIEQRQRVQTALAGLAADAPDSQANFVWVSAPSRTGAELTARLEAAGILVAPGGPLGDDDHVRVSVRGPAATERLLSGLEQALRD